MTDSEDSTWLVDVVEEAAKLILNKLEEDAAAKGENSGVASSGGSGMRVPSAGGGGGEMEDEKSVSWVEEVTGSYRKGYREKMLSLLRDSELTKTYNQGYPGEALTSPEVEGGFSREAITQISIAHLSTEGNKAVAFHRSHSAKSISCCLLKTALKHPHVVVEARRGEGGADLSAELWDRIHMLVGRPEGNEASSILIRRGQTVLVVVQHEAYVCIQEHRGFANNALIRDLSLLGINA